MDEIQETQETQEIQELQELQEEVPEIKRRRRNSNNIAPNGVEMPSGAIPGRPIGSNKPQAKREVRTVEILIQTPTGRLDKKVYEEYRNSKGKYRRLIQTIKGVRG